MIPIMRAATQAVSRGVVQPIPRELSELSLFLSPRLHMIPRIVSRINQGVKDLFSAAATAHTARHVFTPQQAGAAVRVDDALIYDLLVDIDSLLFELNAIAELMKALFTAVYSHAGKPLLPGQAGKAIQKVLADANKDSSWFRKLNDTRNLFAHNATPYLAIDISNDPWDLIIMKKNLFIFSNPTEFLLLKEINEIVHGFVAARTPLQQHLAGIYW